MMNKFNIDIQTSNAWHVLHGEVEKGPYTYEEMIQKLQTLEVFEFDYVWAPHLETWTPIAQLPDFSYDRLQRLLEKNNNHDAFAKRKNKRVEFNHTVICHNDQSMWNGYTISVSEGGASLMMQNPTLVPGHKVILYFSRKEDTDTAFAIEAEVVAKKLTKQKIKYNSGMVYSVRFLSEHATGIQQIKKWIE